MLYQPDVFSTVIKLVGAEKVVFASDFPLLTQARVLKDLEASGVGADVRNKVLGENAARLLKLTRTGKASGSAHGA